MNPIALRKPTVCENFKMLTYSVNLRYYIACCSYVAWNIEWKVGCRWLETWEKAALSHLKLSSRNFLRHSYESRESSLYKELVKCNIMIMLLQIGSICGSLNNEFYEFTPRHYFNDDVLHQIKWTDAPNVLHSQFWFTSSPYSEQGSRTTFEKWIVRK